MLQKIQQRHFTFSFYVLYDMYVRLLWSSSVECGRTLKTVSTDKLLLTRFRQDTMRQSSDQTCLAEVRPHVTVEHVAEEALEW